MSSSSVKIFTCDNTRELAEKIAHSYGKPLGESTVTRFSDGEISTYFNESVRGHNVFLIQSTIPPADNLMEMLLMVDAARRASAKNITVVVPYYGYARQDRKDRPRVSIAAKMIANLFLSAGADRLMTCDLHAGQIQGFFDFPVDHLDGTAIFFPYITNLNLENLVFASPDVGGLSRARNYAKHFGVDLVVCDKHREKANEIASMRIIGNVEDKNVVLVDDLVDTAGTICMAAKIIKEQGARSVRAIATHGVLSGPAYERLAGSQLEELVITDTIPSKETIDKVKVLSVAPMFAEAIRRVHNNESISSLFPV